MPPQNWAPRPVLDEYFEVEVQSSIRFEFRDGAILAMSGGPWKHDDVSVAVSAATSSIREVLLIEAEAVDVRHAFRTDAGWETVRYQRVDAVLELRTGGGTIPLGVIYEG